MKNKKKKGMMLLNKAFEGTKYNTQYEVLKKAFDEANITFELAYNETVLNEVNKDKTTNFDFVLFYDKDIALAKSFENDQVRVFNNANAIALCDDKASTYLFFENDQRVNLIQSVISPLLFSGAFELEDRFIKQLIQRFPYPFIIKETKGSYGQQVHLVESELQLEKVLKLVENRQFIAQNYIESSKGRDIRVWVVNHEIVYIGQRQSNDINEFRSSISQGGHYINNIDVPQKLKEMAIYISKKIGLDFGTIDFLYGEEPDMFYFCEANSNAVFYNVDAPITNKIVAYVKREINA